MSQQDKTPWFYLKSMAMEEYLDAFNAYYAQLETRPKRAPYLVMGKMGWTKSNPRELSLPGAVMASGYDHAFLKQALEDTGGHISHLLTPPAIYAAITDYEKRGLGRIGPEDVVVKILINDRIDKTGQTYLGDTMDTLAFNINS